MSDSPLTRSDLEALGIPAGQIFAKIFRATRGLDRETALVIAQQIHLGIHQPIVHKAVRVIPGSVWAWMIAHPCLSSESKSEVRRMIEQGAIRLNFENDWQPDDQMPPVFELTLFPSGRKRTFLWCTECMSGDTNLSSSCLHKQEAADDIARGNAEFQESMRSKL